MDAGDRLLMLLMGGQGKTSAHQFVRESGVRPLYYFYNYGLPGIQEKTRQRIGKQCRAFIPPKDKDRVLMFEDKSGAYVHEDGLVTFLDSDISDEISNYQEITE